MAKSGTEQRESLGVDAILLEQPSQALAIYCDWQELAKVAIEANVFYEPDLLLPALELLGPFPAFRMLCFFDAHQSDRPLLAVFPLMLREGLRGASLLGWYRSFSHMHCFLRTPLIREDALERVVPALLQWLNDPSKTVRFLELGMLRADGPFFRALERHSKLAAQPGVAMNASTRALFQPRETAEIYLKNALHGKSRKKLRRQREALARLGPIRVDTLAPGENHHLWVQSFLNLEGSGWKAKAGTAMACSANQTAFFREICARLHRHNRLIMQSMWVGDTLLAQRCAFLAARPQSGAFAFKIAYNEEYAEYSPGVLMELDYVYFLHGRKDVPWVDSCADEDNALMNRVWIERRRLTTFVVGSQGIWQRALVSVLPALRQRLGGLRRANWNPREKK